ncbi:MAG: DUF5706 domain-containing protein [Oscillospiraceae bacterium]|nr:DUF5706 domain-containing protein [Oscillospiraceae bacterium]
MGISRKKRNRRKNANKGVPNITQNPQHHQNNHDCDVLKNTNTIDLVLTHISGILENRREQIAERSTVSLAAASGLFVLIISFITGAFNQEREFYIIVIICLIISLLLTAISIITSLDLIKRISRKKNQRKIPEKNILFFGWIATQTEDALYKQYSKLCNDDYRKAQIRQSISLSKNLQYRYNQLKKTYVFFVLGLITYIISITLNILYEHDVFSQLAQWIK